jgi:hypothetical protein
MTSCCTAPGVTVTETLALADPLVAVIVVVPTWIAASERPVIEATAGLELVQTTDALVMTWPSRAVADAANVVVAPDVTVNAADGVIEIPTGVLSGAVVPVDPESPPQLAPTSDSANSRTTDCGTCTRVGERGGLGDSLRRPRAV